MSFTSMELGDLAKGTCVKCGQQGEGCSGTIYRGTEASRYDTGPEVRKDGTLVTSTTHISYKDLAPRTYFICMNCIKATEKQDKKGCIWILIGLSLLSAMFVLLAVTVAVEFMYLAVPAGLGCILGLVVMLVNKHEHGGPGQTAEDIAIEVHRKQEPGRAWLGTDQYDSLKSTDTNRSGSNL